MGKGKTIEISYSRAGSGGITPEGRELITTYAEFQVLLAQIDRLVGRDDIFDFVAVDVVSGETVAEEARGLEDVTILLVTNALLGVDTAETRNDTVWKRSVPEVLTDMDRLLRLGASRDEIQGIVDELESQYESLLESQPAPQHEVDLANTLHAIRAALSDKRLKELGITSSWSFTE